MSGFLNPLETVQSKQQKSLQPGLRPVPRTPYIIAICWTNESLELLNKMFFISVSSVNPCSFFSALKRPFIIRFSPGICPCDPSLRGSSSFLSSKLSIILWRAPDRLSSVLLRVIVFYTCKRPCIYCRPPALALSCRHQGVYHGDHQYVTALISRVVNPLSRGFRGGPLRIPHAHSPGAQVCRRS